MLRGRLDSRRDSKAPAHADRHRLGPTGGAQEPQEPDLIPFFFSLASSFSLLSDRSRSSRSGGTPWCPRRRSCGLCPVAILNLLKVWALREVCHAQESVVGLPDEPWGIERDVEGLCGLPAAALHSMQHSRRSVPACGAIVADYPTCVKLPWEGVGSRARVEGCSVILSEAKNLCEILRRIAPQNDMGYVVRMSPSPLSSFDQLRTGLSSRERRH